MTAKHKPSQARQPKVLPPADETLLQTPSKTEALAGPTCWSAGNEADGVSEFATSMKSQPSLQPACL